MYASSVIFVPLYVSSFATVLFVMVSLIFLVGILWSFVWLFLAVVLHDLLLIFLSAYENTR